MPAEHVREHAAEQHADGAAAGGNESEDTHRLRALGRLGEEHHDERERDRRHNRGAKTLNCARCDEHLLRVGEAEMSEAPVKPRFR